MPDEASYTVRGVEQVLGLPRATVMALVAAGFVAPSRGARNELRFRFQDLVLMRTAQSLRIAHLSTRSIVRALDALRGELPAELPISGLRILAVGDAVAVRDGDSLWEAETGQLLLSFDREPSSGAVLVESLDGSTDGRAKKEALTQFDRAIALEATDDHAAEASYREAIRLDPCFEDAYLNLGAMLCEAGRCKDAVVLYDQATRHCGESPLVHFNRGIALEDRGQISHAIEAYGRALQLDPAFADAHYNSAVLMERSGDAQAALRHFSAYRRLSRSQDG
ncbi:tetratricopeptide repeat protein [Paucibacter sp. R3-3]|uniref:Tetratricopeptide repeat protein n=1 Tax=Roseateles agri TaxID=3098619 RepID=A0ABU5DPE2_9BURK|nr:tetratricopeptide repeat protein [Paucibacter sp. R3-3]MDY0747603.1 tetratricopeptide repeat protein [Paucibacter sp. R3-3]